MLIRQGPMQQAARGHNTHSFSDANFAEGFIFREVKGVCVCVCVCLYK